MSNDKLTFYEVHKERLSWHFNRKYVIGAYLLIAFGFIGGVATLIRDYDPRQPGYDLIPTLFNAIDPPKSAELDALLEEHDELVQAVGPDSERLSAEDQYAYESLYTRYQLYHIEIGEYRAVRDFWSVEPGQIIEGMSWPFVVDVPGVADRLSGLLTEFTNRDGIDPRSDQALAGLLLAASGMRTGRHKDAGTIAQSYLTNANLAGLEPSHGYISFARSILANALLLENEPELALSYLNDFDFDRALWGFDRVLIAVAHRQQGNHAKSIEVLEKGISDLGQDWAGYLDVPAAIASTHIAWNVSEDDVRDAIMTVDKDLEAVQSAWPVVERRPPGVQGYLASLHALKADGLARLGAVEASFKSYLRAMRHDPYMEADLRRQLRSLGYLEGAFFDWLPPSQSAFEDSLKQCLIDDCAVRYLKVCPTGEEESCRQSLW